MMDQTGVAPQRGDHHRADLPPPTSDGADALRVDPHAAGETCPVQGGDEQRTPPPPTTTTMPVVTTVVSDATQGAPLTSSPVSMEGLTLAAARRSNAVAEPLSGDPADAVSANHDATGALVVHDGRHPAPRVYDDEVDLIAVDDGESIDGGTDENGHSEVGGTLLLPRSKVEPQKEEEAGGDMTGVVGIAKPPPLLIDIESGFALLSLTTATTVPTTQHVAERPLAALSTLPPRFPTASSPLGCLNRWDGMAIPLRGRRVVEGGVSVVEKLLARRRHICGAVAAALLNCHSEELPPTALGTATRRPPPPLLVTTWRVAWPLLRFGLASGTVRLNSDDSTALRRIVQQTIRSEVDAPYGTSSSSSSSSSNPFCILGHPSTSLGSLLRQRSHAYGPTLELLFEWWQALDARVAHVIDELAHDGPMQRDQSVEAVRTACWSLMLEEVVEGLWLEALARSRGLVRERIVSGDTQTPPSLTGRFAFCDDLCPRWTIQAVVRQWALAYMRAGANTAADGVTAGSFATIVLDVVDLLRADVGCDVVVVGDDNDDIVAFVSSRRAAIPQDVAVEFDRLASFANANGYLDEGAHRRRGESEAAAAISSERDRAVDTIVEEEAALMLGYLHRHMRWLASHAPPGSDLSRPIAIVPFLETVGEQSSATNQTQLEGDDDASASLFPRTSFWAAAHPPPRAAAGTQPAEWEWSAGLPLPPGTAAAAEASENVDIDRRDDDGGGILFASLPYCQAMNLALEQAATIGGFKGCHSAVAALSRNDRYPHVMINAKVGVLRGVYDERVAGRIQASSSFLADVGEGQFISEEIEFRHVQGHEGAGDTRRRPTMIPTKVGLAMPAPCWCEVAATRGHVSRALIADAGVTGGDSHHVAHAAATRRSSLSCQFHLWRRPLATERHDGTATAAASGAMPYVSDNEYLDSRHQALTPYVQPPNDTAAARGFQMDEEVDWGGSVSRPAAADPSPTETGGQYANMVAPPEPLGRPGGQEATGLSSAYWWDHLVNSLDVVDEAMHQTAPAASFPGSFNESRGGVVAKGNPSIAAAAAGLHHHHLVSCVVAWDDMPPVASEPVQSAAARPAVVSSGAMETRPMSSSTLPPMTRDASSSSSSSKCGPSTPAAVSGASVPPSHPATTIASCDVDVRPSPEAHYWQPPSAITEALFPLVTAQRMPRVLRRVLSAFPQVAAWPCRIVLDVQEAARGATVRSGSEFSSHLGASSDMRSGTTAVFEAGFGTLLQLMAADGGGKIHAGVVAYAGFDGVGQRSSSRLNWSMSSPPPNKSSGEGEQRRDVDAPTQQHHSQQTEAAKEPYSYDIRVTSTGGGNDVAYHLLQRSASRGHGVWFVDRLVRLARSSCASQPCDAALNDRPPPFAAREKVVTAPWRHFNVSISVAANAELSLAAAARATSTTGVRASGGGVRSSPSRIPASSPAPPVAINYQATLLRFIRAASPLGYAAGRTRPLGGELPYSCSGDAQPPPSRILREKSSGGSPSLTESLTAGGLAQREADLYRKLPQRKLPPRAMMLTTPTAMVQPPPAPPESTQRPPSPPSLGLAHKKLVMNLMGTRLQQRGSSASPLVAASGASNVIGAHSTVRLAPLVPGVAQLVVDRRVVRRAPSTEEVIEGRVRRLLAVTST